MSDIGVLLAVMFLLVMIPGLYQYITYGVIAVAILFAFSK